MATHDYNIANQGFPAFRADLNNALAAIVSNNSSATEPATTFAYQWWMDTAADPSVLKVRNADNDAWITLGTFNQSTDTFTPSGASSDKIEEGNSKVEVVDTGTGHILFQVDGAEVARFNPDQLVTKAGTASTPAVSPTGDLNTGIFFPAADTIAFAEGGAEAMRIDSGGNVAIGATSVTSGVRLDVVSADSSQSFIDVLKVKTTNTGDVHPAILFENNRGSISNAFKIAMDADASAGTSSFIIKMKDSGGTFNNQIQLSNNGLFRFNSGYGSVANAYGCRAWVNFNGTATPAIRGSGNVSSITDLGTGQYVVNFTTAMPDANYGICTHIQAAAFFGVDSTNPPTTSSFEINSYNSAVSLFDPSYIDIAVFR